MNQKEAVNQIQSFLAQRGLKIEPGYLQVGEQPCIVLEKDNKYIAVDPGSGIWTGSGGKWNCISPTYTLTDALMAVQFLVDQQL